MIDQNNIKNGYTLVELLVVLAITSILLILAAPSYTSIIQNNRMAAQINDLQASLGVARSEAVKRNSNITVCKSKNGTSCTGDWGEGWIVYLDLDSDGAVDDTDQILRVFDEIDGDNTLSFSASHLTFGGSGLARNGAISTFTLCDARGSGSVRGLIISATGRPRLTKDKDAAGNDLSCSA